MQLTPCLVPPPRLFTALLLLILPLAAAVPAARSETPRLQRWSVELPGAPATVVAADVNDDGLEDLAVAVAYTRWDEIGIEESQRIDEVDGLVEVLTIVPALLNRRELHLFFGTGDGYRRAAPPLELPLSVVGLFAGPEATGLAVVALTDDGLSRLVLDAPEQANPGATVPSQSVPNQNSPHQDPQSQPPPTDSTGELRLDPVLTQRSVLAGTSTFLPGLDLVHDLDGDGRLDLLLPSRRALIPYLATDEGLVEGPPVLVPRDESSTGRQRFYPLPQVRDVTGDGLPELLFPQRRTEWGDPSIAPNLGGGRFGRLLTPLEGLQPPAPPPNGGNTGDEGDAPEVVALLDLDGDGRAEYITEQTFETDDDGLRQALDEARRPRGIYRVYATDTALRPTGPPRLTLDAEGYAFGSDGAGISGGFQDLDGDGRQDFVTLTLDFSIFQAVRIMATQRISVGLDFHVYCQVGDNSAPRLEKVPDLDLSGKFRLDLDDLSVGRIAQFAGDFDGDGRADFVQMGRGREVTVHLGRAGCRYPSEPDFALRLDDEPADLSLVKIDDYDADGLADLLLLVPRPSTEAAVTTPVRLDLYRSGGQQ